MALKKKKVAPKKKAPVKKAPVKKAAVKKKAAAKKPAKKAAKKLVTGPARIITPSFVIAFPSLFKSKTNDKGKEEYGCTMYFDKDSTDMTKIEHAVNGIIQDEFKGKKAGVNMPLRDGDDENDNYSTYEGTENCLVLSAKSVFKPGVVDTGLEDIIDPGMIYPGAICRASITAFAYDVNGNKGISFSLNNVQFLTDGDPLTGAGTKAADEFADAEDAEYDEPEAEEEEAEEEVDGEEETEGEEEEAEEGELEVYENDDGVMVYLDEDGEEQEYNEEDWEDE